MSTFEVRKAGWSRRVVKSSGVTDPKVTFYCDEELIDMIDSLGDFYRINIEPLYVEEPGEKETKPSQLAAIIGQDAAFPDYLRKYFSPQIKMMMASGLWEGTAEEKCASAIRYICSVDSRSELDTEGPAMDIFYSDIYNPFQEFKKELAR